MNEDMALVIEYARTQSEAAFSQLVARYVNLVYSVAWRQTQDAQLAEEVSQAAFLVLARKAGALSATVPLSGWLCRTTRNLAANAVRARQRRQIREQEAYMRAGEQDRDPWIQIEPLLEKALAQLSRRDHDAIVLRYLEGKKLAEVAVALGTTENAAKTRVSRALEKLRRYFARQGAVFPSAAIAGAIGAHSVSAAPATMAASILAAAVTPGATTVSGSTLTLVKGALQLMAWAKAKTIIGIGVGVLLAGGAAQMAWPDREPVYEGKSVSAWIKQLYATSSRDLTAHFALAEMGEPALPYLIRELKHEASPNHRGDLAYVLTEMGPRAWPAVPALIPSLGRPQYQPEQFSAVTALGSIGPAASNAVPALAQALKAEDFNVRMEAAKALAKIGVTAPEALPELTHMLTEDQATVRLGAVLALWRLQPNDPAAFDRVKEYALHHPDANVRFLTAFDLGHLGPAAKVFIPILADALNDADSKVQGVAKQSLEQLALMP